MFRNSITRSIPIKAKWLTLPILLWIMMILVVPSGILSGESSYDLGMEAFRSNNMTQAEESFRTALSEPSPDPSLYIYLGLIYQQLNRPDEAETIMKNGLTAVGAPVDNLHFNLGNLLILKEA